VFLKDEGRIEAFFTLYFLALLVQALIERELRLAMKRENIDELPLYPRAASVRTPHDRTDPAPVQPRRTSPADRWCTHCAGLRRSPHGIAASAAQATRRPGRLLSPAGLATKFAPNCVLDVRNVSLASRTTYGALYEENPCVDAVGRMSWKRVERLHRRTRRRRLSPSPR
jgi:hypothetical protein